MQDKSTLEAVIAYARFVSSNYEVATAVELVKTYVEKHCDARKLWDDVIPLTTLIRNHEWGLYYLVKNAITPPTQVKSYSLDFISSKDI